MIDPPRLACFFVPSCAKFGALSRPSDFTNPFHHDRPPKEAQNTHISLSPNRNWLANAYHECDARQSRR